MVSDKITAEKELVFALKNKKPAGIKILYENYGPALLNIISRIVKDEEAADVLQIVLIKIWNTAPFYDNKKGRLFTWTLHVARNCALDVLRSKAYKDRRRCQCLDDCFQLIERQKNTMYNTDTIGLRNIVNNLEPKFREVIDLVYFNGFTHMEAAEELNMKLGTVKTRIRYAIAEIRKMFIV